MTKAKQDLEGQFVRLLLLTGRLTGGNEARARFITTRQQRTWEAVRGTETTETTETVLSELPAWIYAEPGVRKPLQSAILSREEETVLCTRAYYTSPSGMCSHARRCARNRSRADRVSISLTWYHTLDEEMKATLASFSDEDLLKTIDPRGFTVELQLDVYLQAQLIFLGKASVYFKAMNRALSQLFQDYIG